MRVAKTSKEAAPWLLEELVCVWCRAILADITEDDIVSWYEKGDPPLSDSGTRYGIRCPECKHKNDLGGRIPKYVRERNDW